MSLTRKLLLSVAAVGLVAGVGYRFLLPHFQDSQVSAQVSEILPAVESCKKLIANAVQTTTAPALSQSMFICDGGASAGVSIPKFLKSIAISAVGTITVTLDYRALPAVTPISNVLTFSPMVNQSDLLGAADVRKTIVSWRCGSPRDGTTIDQKYLPKSCNA